MFCTKCGNQIKDGFKFCPKCGTPVYVEKETPQSEIKAQVEEVKEETSKEEPEIKKVVKAKKTTKPKSVSSSKKTSASTSYNQNYIPNPLIAKELDIEGVKKMANKGNKAAILRQAFRYEMGIGCDVDIQKAEDLYSQVGGSGTLFNLENSHINSVLPDPLYDIAIPPTYEDNEKNESKLKVLPFVKDLMLDYAYKVEADKQAGNYSEEKSEEYKMKFFDGLNRIRYSHPEMFIPLYFNKIEKEEKTKLYQRIRENASHRYSLKWIPSLYTCIDYIDGNKIEIPSLYHICSKGSFVLYYDSKETKLKLLNQFAISILSQIPVKKIRLNIVDVAQKYEAKDLIKNLCSRLYGDSPIINEEQLDQLFKRLEKRRLEIEKKYGNYPDYCEKNMTIPLPYEIIFLFDTEVDEDYEKKIESITSFGNSVGVYLVRFTKSVSISFNDNDIFTPSKNYILSRSKTNNYILNTGVFYQKDSENSNYISFPSHSYTANGYGDIEVVIKPRGIWNYGGWKNMTDYTSLSNLFKIPEKVFREINYERDFVISSFPSISEAVTYINDFCSANNFPELFKYNPPCICLYPSFRVGLVYCRNEIALYIPVCNNLYQQYYQDLSFYLELLGLNKEKCKLIEDVLLGKKAIYEVEDTINNNDTGEITTLFNKKSEALSNKVMLDSKKYYGYFFAYWPEPKYWSFSKCEEAIEAVEKKVIQKAEKKWGKDYYLTHLCFGNKMMNKLVGGLYITYQMCKHYKIPILQYSWCEGSDILNFSDYYELLNKEYIMKEDTTIALPINNNISNSFEEIISNIIIPIGKADGKDADFRMDLVSHVHSFIIGQSGSGKSVFLHNIIGGAMLKYAPEDLQLYLLDFKLGGVEFNRYQGAKHVKALLVDNSDPQVTLEILRELRNSMTERGKLLRSAGVNNIGEYNKLHQQDRMPHVLVVADECHEMFKADDSIPRQVRNEISDIVIKIAKEGRSQGVHLVFATQTLSGTEISSEIINNVSDFYLLKCAQTDSERLVPNSSSITSELSTGQIYYHHVDEQVKFQAYYTDKEAAEKLMAAIVEKAKDHKSNGEFYFNGAQMFYLDESVKEQIQNVKGKSPAAFLGKAIDISQKDLYIKLNEDFSENVLLLGLNDQEQVTRTTMNLFVSLMMSAKLKHKDIAFKVIDCLNNEEGEVHELVFDLENEGYCEIIERRQRSKFFMDLAKGVQDGTAEETILLILGQDRFRELKMDMELEDGNSSKGSDEDMMSISDDFFGDSGSSSLNVKTYKDALKVILDKGPDYGVHTLLQIEKASNLLFEDYITPKVVFQKFKHLVMLRSDETAGVTLHLNDDIRLEKLSSDWERLRAYYYAEESDSYTLFTPYMPSDAKTIINLLKMI